MTQQMPSRSRLIELVKPVLEEQKLRDAIVYILKHQLLPETSYVFSRITFSVNQPSLLFFIDEEPGVNWSHNCRYVAIGTEIKTITAKFPPPAHDLILLIKPDKTEDWKLLTDNEYK